MYIQGPKSRIRVDVHDSFSDRRQTKSSTHDLDAQHLLLDEDNALIGTSDDVED